MDFRQSDPRNPVVTGVRGPKGAAAAGPSVTRLVPPTFVDNSKRAHQRNTYKHMYIYI